MIAVGVWEHLDSNPHCHVLISASDAESAWLLGEGNKSWLWLQPRGQFYIREIEAPRKVISYITKEILQAELTRPAVCLPSAAFEAGKKRFRCVSAARGNARNLLTV